MKFPMAFKCSDCDEQHVSHFQAAFVLDTAGNWYFDLGEEKGWTGVTQEQYDTLMHLLVQRTRLLCPKHAEESEAAVDSTSGQRVFAQ
jgi:hypothetical protein